MKIIIIILQIIGGLTLIPWFAVSGLSFMAFDSPKSYRRIAPWIFVISIFLYPFVVAMSFWKAWECVVIGNTQAALIFSGIPIVVFILAYIFMTRGSDILEKIRQRGK
jgi:hypothetical protein